MQSTFQFPSMQQSQNQSIVKVNGIKGAAIYQVPAGTSAVLFDACKEQFYIKSCDIDGFTRIQAYKYRPLSEEDKGYVTRTEFDELKKMLEIQ